MYMRSLDQLYNKFPYMGRAGAIAQLTHRYITTTLDGAEPSLGYTNTALTPYTLSLHISNKDVSCIFEIRV